MNEIYTQNIVVRSTDTDLNDNLRPAALLQYFQELGTAHSAILRMDRDYLIRHYHACWILARVWYRLERPVHGGETLRIDTWHRGAGGMTFYRDYALYSGDEQIGEGVSAWVVADVDNRKMLRPSAIDSIAEAKAPEHVSQRQLKLIREQKDKVWAYDRTVRCSDLDVNGHMNNTKYADVLLDAFAPEELAGRFVSQLQLNYSQECKMGETMQIFRRMDGESCYIDGCSGDKNRRFEATVQFRGVSGKLLDEVKESE